MLYTEDRIVGKVQGWNQCAVYLRQDCWLGSRMEPMCCALKTGLLVRFKDGTNVLYT